MKKTIKIMMMTSFVLMFSGCVSNNIIRNNNQDKGQISKSYENIDNPNSTIETYDHKGKQFSLSYVEVDDQGLFYSRDQLSSVLDHVKGINEPQDIVVFVHGWRHNADTNDLNVRGLRRYLAGLSSINSKQKVTGIYVGWRGKNFDIPFFPFGLEELFTFYNRKDVSIEIGGGQILELFIELEKIKNANPKSRLFIVGHSFGGSIVMTALNKILVSRSLTGDKGLYEGFGTAVVLVNPAIEGTHYFQIRELSERLNKKEFSAEDNPLPRLIVATSSEDFATKMAFPIARSISTLFTENHKTLKRPGYVKSEYSERKLDIFAMGHIKSFRTHELEANGSMGNEKCNPALSKSWDIDMYKNFAQNKKYIFPSSKLEISFLKNSHLNDPFWVIMANNDVITGHNGIFNKNFGCLIAELYFPDAEPTEDMPDKTFINKVKAMF